jgi:predicted PurR-regulated permease PerM
VAENRDRGPFLSNPFVARAARWGLLAWSVIGVLILLWVVYRYALYPIRVIFPPIVVALIVVYLLNPLVNELQRRRVPRIWGTLLVYLVVLTAIGTAIAYLSVVVTHQVTQFVHGVPALLSRAQSWLQSVSDRLGLNLDAKSVVAAFEPGKGSAFNFFGRLTSFTSGVVRLAFVLVLGPLIAFYLLVDLPKIRRGAEGLIPATRREEVNEVAGRVGATVGGFFRGQLIAALIIGLVSMAGFYIIGLPYFALLGAITGLFALVPLIGTVIAAIPVLFVALTSSRHGLGLFHAPGGWRLAIASVIVLILVQQLDQRLLSPRLLSRASRMHPVTVLLSLLVGGALLGLWGMLLIVPAVAAVKVLFLFFWDTRSQWPPPVESMVEREIEAEQAVVPPLPAPEAPTTAPNGPPSTPAADGAGPEDGDEPEERRRRMRTV